MDLPETEKRAATVPSLKQATIEKVRIFRWLVGSLFGLIAATFILMMWVIGSPDSHQQHLEEFGPAAQWPDGSAKTAQDWWAKPGAKPPIQVAQPPAATPAKPPSQGQG